MHCTKCVVLFKLLFLGLFALTFTSAFAGNNPAQDQLLFAKIHSNVRYFYPDRHINKLPWQYFVLSNVGTIPSRDTLNGYLADVTQRYERAGIHVKLYSHNPVTANAPADKVKGYHWSYKGFGDSHNDQIAGKLIGVIYDLFLNAYPKHFKKVNHQYLDSIQNNKSFSFDTERLYVRIEDSVWLGIPWQAKRIKKSDMQAAILAGDTAGKKPFLLQSLITTWSAVYQFYPYPIQKHWDSIFTEAFYQRDKVANRVEMIKTVAHPLVDAHAHIPPYLPRGFLLEYLDGKLLVSQYDTLVIKRNILCAELLTFNGKNAQQEFQKQVSLMSGRNQKTNEWLACRALVFPYSDSMVEATFLDKNGKDTIRLHLPIDRHRRYYPERTDPSKTRIASEKGICYLDLSHTSALKLKRKIKNPAYTSYILDVRYGNVVAFNKWGWFINTKLKDNLYLIPRVEYPGKTVVKNDSVIQFLNPVKNHLPKKEMVFLANEMDVSSEESFLSLVQYGNMGKIIGRHTAGTTGNIVMLEVWPKSYYAYIPFTGMLTLKPDGSPWTGIAPDIEVPRTGADLCTQRDEILEAAIKYLKGKQGK